MTLRSDNADLRLTEKGRAAGAVGDSRWKRFEATRAELARVTELLQSCVLSPQVRAFWTLNHERLLISVAEMAGVWLRSQA